MKIWWGYGSEHSMNLVMIGKFASVGEAEAAKQLIDRLAEGVQNEVDAGERLGVKLAYRTPVR
jgi:hypothetical protein